MSGAAARQRLVNQRRLISHRCRKGVPHLMGMQAELDGLARRLAPRKDRAHAVMLVPVSPGDGAVAVAQGLAAASYTATGRPVWLYDLDFSNNRQASQTELNGEAFAGELGGLRFWRADPEGVGRLAMRRSATAPIYVSRFERPPGSVKRVVFHPSAPYWRKARKACGLVLVDAPADSAGVAGVASDMDGVVLVADAAKDSRAAADDAAARIEEAGGHVFGVVVNHSRPAR